MPEQLTLSEPKETESLNGPVPFERMVVHKLFSALEAVSDEESGDDPGSLDSIDEEYAEELAENGVTANLCEAVKEMVSRPELSRVEVKVSWSRKVSVPERSEKRLVFVEADAERLIKISNQLRRMSDLRTAAITGRVVGLDRPVGRPGGIARVRCEVENIGSRVVRIELDQEHEYQKAIDAHNTRGFLTALGYLQLNSRTAYLLNPKEISVSIEEPSQSELQRLVKEYKQRSN